MAPHVPHPLRATLAGMPLRRKLVLSIVTLFVALTLATGAATVTLVSKGLHDSLDASVAELAQRPPQRGGAGEHRPDGDEPFRRSGLFVEALGGYYSGYAYTEAGDPVTLSAAQVRAILGSGAARQQPASVELGGELGEFRVVAGVDRGDATVYRGLPENATNDTVERLLWTTLAFGLVGLVLVAFGGSWLVRRNLAPLERVAAVAGRVSRTPLARGAVELHERVPVQDTDPRTEVGQVGVALNELLEHVDTSLRARHSSETQLRQFVADASHELRTPLASIRGYAELSRRETEPVPDGVTRALSRIDSESQRMASLVEDLLLLARLDAGRELTREPVDLTMMLVDSVSDARAAGPDHAWRLDLPEEAVGTAGDPARLTQVVLNLLANARVHTPPGTTVTAGVRAEPHTPPSADGTWAGGPAAVVTVADDGPGIPPGLLPRIFSRFTRGDEARTRLAQNGGSAVAAAPSTGLGLSIVAAVVAAHHGQVQVESRPGRTVFTVRLPLAAL